MNTLSADVLERPLVTVHCLTYNHMKTIAQAIESILSQKTDFDFELIIHDDASTDGTAEIVQQYASQYPAQIHAICQPINQFHSCNLIHTYLQPISKGTFIALCDGDDYWTDPLKLQTQVNFMLQNPSASLCFHAVSQQAPDGSFTQVHPWYENAWIPAEQMIRRGGLFCPTVSCMFRRDVMDCWPEFRLCADVYDYPAQILAATMGKVYYLDKVMAVYRYASAGSWTASHEHETDFAHLENEEKWLEMFNRDSQYRYGQDVDYHLTHLWFTEYRKNPSAKIFSCTARYVRRLRRKDRVMFAVLLFLFRILGKRAEPTFHLLKKIFI